MIKEDKMNQNGVVLTVVLMILIASCTGRPRNILETGDEPVIFPDYKEVTVPSNIASLNFKVLDTCESVFAEIAGGEKILRVSAKNKIIIPLRKWKRLLSRNEGGNLSVTVYMKQNGAWNKCKPFHIFVSEDPVDGYLVYRLIAPGYIAYAGMGIYQRNISDFEEHPIVSTELIPNTCMNCHSFRLNDPDNMLFHIRASNGGTMLIQDGTVKKLNTKTDEMISAGVYPFWHPSGKYVAFSVNKIYQMFHSVKEKRIEVFDTESDLVLYDVDASRIITDSIISSGSSFETFPAFTPDGRSLVFATTRARVLPEEYSDVRYDLCRVDFDPETGTFGDHADTLVLASALGKSVSFPRVSPDGKFLMYTLSDYGNFSIWHQSADLYLLDMQTGESGILNVNSEDTESYHSWSSDSRWFVFSSRRIDGLYTRLYIASIDENGVASKPFLLPQRDPDFYWDMMKSYNVPEWVTGPVDFNAYQLEEIYKGNTMKQVGYETLTTTTEKNEP
jgi:Tol biopolymer transport system component